MSRRSAACAHWYLRCCVGTTTTTRRITFWTSARRPAVSAKVVLPAPGVATARKLGELLASNWASASYCHGRSGTGPCSAARTAYSPLGTPSAGSPWAESGVSKRDKVGGRRGRAGEGGKVGRRECGKEGRGV